MNASRSPAEHATALLDLLVTVAMGIAAVLLIWRTLGAPTSSRERLSHAVEDVASAELVTTIKGAPTLGSPSAPVVLIEYSDFECPYCARHAGESFEWIERDFVTNGQVQYGLPQLPDRNTASVSGHRSSVGPLCGSTEQVLGDAPPPICGSRAGAA